jgi:hypothetical protein
LLTTVVLLEEEEGKEEEKEEPYTRWRIRSSKLLSGSASGST